MLPNLDPGFPKPKKGEVIRGVPKSGPAYSAGLRDGMIFLNGKISISASSGTAEIAFRVRDGNRERVINFPPASKEPIKAQELKDVANGAAGSPCSVHAAQSTRATR
ncbi:MAG TPA: hypothetical protein VIL42_08395 [Sphingomicrobium sp.]